MVPVSCKLCSDLGGVETKYSTLDEQETHAQIHTNQLGYYISDDGGDPMRSEEIFGKCFPLDNFDKPKENDKSRSKLMEICQRIIQTKKNESNTIECQECGANVPYVRYKPAESQKTELILIHACSHLTKKPFVCQLCQHDTATKQKIVRHIKEVHKIDSPVSGLDFDENWPDCFDEMMETLKKCFGEVALDPDWSTYKPSLPCEMTIQRRSIFKKILQSVRVAKKIRCDVCQKEFRAKEVYQLERHIHAHLQRQIYECIMCEHYTSIHKCNSAVHLAKEHGVPPNGKYIDRSDEHHGAIMELIKKCFGKEKNK